jgi:hypothetical protein
MRTVYGFAYGVISTLLAVSYLIPAQTIVVQETVIEETIIIEEIMTTLDLDQMRDTLDIDPTLEDELLAQCAYILIEETDEPMAGVIYYLEQYWQGDACAALDHYWAHGWY